MLKHTRRLLILAAVLVGLGLATAPQAEAGWWHRHCGYRYYGWYGYYGCGLNYYWGCNSCWTPSCYRPVYVYRTCSPCYSYYSCARPVIRHCYVPYRVYSCCSICSCDPCCCGSVSSSVVDSPSDVQATQKPTLAPLATPAPTPAPAAGTPNDPTPTPARTFAEPDSAEPASKPAPTPPFSLDPDPAPTTDPLGPMPVPSTDPTPSTDPLLPDPGVPSRSLDPLQDKGVSAPTSEGTISILVPENAQVTINGYVTKSTGRVRRYVAQNLEPGLVYPFNVQVKVVRDGRALTDQRQVKLAGGALEAVVFNFDKTSVDRIAQAY